MIKASLLNLWFDIYRPPSQHSHCEAALKVNPTLIDSIISQTFKRKHVNY